MPLLKDANGKPKNFAITQEELKNYKPPSSGICYSIVFICLFITCAVISVLFFVSYSRCFEWKIPYNASSDLVINVEQDITKKIVIYYAFDSFYQNHRRFISSKDEKQLMGKGITEKNLRNCDPRIYDDKNAPVERCPCGLIAATQFDDSFQFSNDISISKKNIIRKGDERLYKKDACYFNDLDEDAFNDFIVWMRIAAFPFFRKKYGVIEDGLPKGDYNITVNGNYPSPPGGKKYIILATETALGRKNPFLAYAFAIMAFICLVFSFITFFFYYWERGKKNEFIKLVKL